MRTQNRLSWLIALVGLWQALSPFILGYTEAETAMWNGVLIGIALVILGVWSAVSNNITTDRWLSWINAALGLWLIVSPFLLGFTEVSSALWNNIIVGIITIILGAWAALSVPSRDLERPRIDID